MVKERADHQRIYDKDGYKKRAACVCVKNEHESEVLLITSSRNMENWIIPGGGIEDNENPEDAAEREVYEEAGVQGRLGRLLGIFESKERKHRTNVYLLIVDKEYDEWEEHKILGRRRKWFNLEEAKIELEKHKPVQGSYLNLLKGYNSIECSSGERDYNQLMTKLTTNLPYLSTHSSSTSTSNSSSYSSSPSLQQALTSTSSTNSILCPSCNYDNNNNCSHL